MKSDNSNIFSKIRDSIQKLLVNFFGFRIIKNENFIQLDKLKSIKVEPTLEYEPHLEGNFIKICDKLEKTYKTNLFRETNYTTYQITKNIINKNLNGCFVECGVYRGVKISFILETLKALNVHDRKIFLVDTFEGQTDPGGKDLQVITKTKLKKKDNYASLSEVKKNIEQSDYPSENIHFIKIDARKTEELKNKIFEKIVFLRIDTDFYDSVLSVLNSLYFQVVSNGYIIHDDYGHWKGHYLACEEFYKKNNIKPLLIRTCRKERVEII